MSTIVVGEIPTEEFALEETFQLVPEVTFESERAVDHADDVRMPLLWAREADGARVAQALQQDPSTESITLLTDYGDQQLYRVSWSPEVQRTLRLLTDAGGSILDVRGDAASWQFRLFYPNRRAVSIVNGGADKLTFSMSRVGELEQKSAVRYGLTEKQHETLRTGWTRGYFDVPRRIGIEELSTDLGVTHQAVSERLRRGQATLIKEALGLYDSEEESASG